MAKIQMSNRARRTADEQSAATAKLPQGEVAPSIALASDPSVDETTDSVVMAVREDTFANVPRLGAGGPVPLTDLKIGDQPLDEIAGATVVLPTEPTPAPLPDDGSAGVDAGALEDVIAAGGVDATALDEPVFEPGSLAAHLSTIIRDLQTPADIIGWRDYGHETVVVTSSGRKYSVSHVDGEVTDRISGEVVS